MQSNLFIEQQGSGPDLVLLHGWGVHSGFWQPILHHLTPHFRITIIDLPGFGRSPLLPNMPYDLEQLAKQVLAVAPQKAIWLGWSLGGMVATQIAMMAAQRVERLICVASSPRFIREAGWPGVKLSLVEKLKSLLNNASEDTLARLLAMQFKNTTISRRHLIKLRSELFQYGLPHIEALQGGIEIALTVDLRSQLCNLSCPTLYLLGKRDLLVPPAIAVKIDQLLTPGSAQIIQQACHAPFLSSPDDFLQCIREFTAV
jgi:pimeloyl-[acyl-carrier protein] methyl ester esterase